MPSTMSGYILFKDKRTVLFYLNVLCPTMTKTFYHGDEEESHDIVNGLETIHRWTGLEYINQSSFLAPALVAAYNKFMNGVDCFDQFRLTHATVRREKRVNMSRFTYLLDLAVINAFQVYKKLCDDGKIGNGDMKLDLTKFKCSISRSLTDPCESRRSIGLK